MELSSGQLGFARGQVWRLKLGLKTWSPPSRHSRRDYPASALFASKCKEIEVCPFLPGSQSPHWWEPYSSTSQFNSTCTYGSCCESYLKGWNLHSLLRDRQLNQLSQISKLLSAKTHGWPVLGEGHFHIQLQTEPTQPLPLTSVAPRAAG